MGKIKQGPFGGVSGKIGNLVGASWKGISYFRILPVSVSNPRTAPQIAQRTALANVVKFCKTFNASFTKPLWDRFAQRASGWNDIIEANIKRFDLAIMDDAALFIASVGQMSKTQIAGFTAAVGDLDFTLSWVDDSGQGFKLADDEVYILVARRSTVGAIVYDYHTGGNTGVTRDAETATVTVPLANDSGNVLDAYLCFRRKDGTVVSNSQHGTQTVP